MRRARGGGALVNTAERAGSRDVWASGGAVGRARGSARVRSLRSVRDSGSRGTADEGDEAPQKGAVTGRGVEASLRSNGKVEWEGLMGAGGDGVAATGRRWVVAPLVLRVR